MTEAFTFKAGGSPLLVSMPHVGTRVPEAIAAGMSVPMVRLVLVTTV